MAREAPEVKEQGKDDLRFARDVMIAYDYLGRDIDVSIASPSAVALHDWCCNPENRKDFLGMAQKATDLIAKHSKDNTPDDQERAEHKSIQELKVFLARAVEEATSASSSSDASHSLPLSC